ncbi:MULTISPECIES: bifunctional 2-polyprenyl-6-hydroxyphenol methylase/3-demethylubiquinol 3-O-methyltransferase UbiG [Bacillales]|jgi:SAM-dependent methyltransferase|uniref:SAM-dependent methyltransferase n=1 Tax=Brevibacillus aydinogluensis TaxID=927786 RepID=A0AA48M8D8_9BACL|nr:MULTISPECIES: class I SAM-dependent methyltransferase [Bacillales]REK61486.1 MAG: class I SAM-dependent methyltransferase [Brevibacillus sp.]MBR8660315.1 class I SAM-dependent methyltransferase [Brevibacillus sp. NL20B1]MDT3416523.1 SAM-dependent methyltransferase [Brevibacillus aydinogluensis]NNV03536.1 class I SAM-dependent methyltransferase [Brevibacillus sp. MCWH]UFJ60189.1 class I SAM-dependent methyltransferase [Anoxybacillus sediminis]
MAEDWFERSFREDYVLVYQHRDDASADEEIANLLERLPIKRTGRVLDLCCGSGRHSRALARRGYDVVGVDLSSVLLQLAEEQNSFPNLRFYRYDMRHIPFREEFDIVVNLFTSFGYFTSDAENEQVVHNMAAALKPGGEVVIDYLNPAYVKAHLVPRSTKEVTGLFIEEERWIEDGFVKKRIVVNDAEQSEPRIYLEQVRLFSVEEMTAMLRRAGFERIEIYGDYEFRPYAAETSPRMIFYAHKCQATS